MELKNKEYYLIATEFDGIESDYIKFTQNDTNNSVLNISVPYPSDQLLLCVTKPDGNDVVDRFVASDETNTNFNMELPINLINLPGTYKATVQAYGHDDDRRTVGTFKYRIASDFNTDFIESNENYPVLTKLISDVNSLYDKVVDIDHGEGGRILAEEQRVQAEIVRKGNEVIRENQEIAREERLKEVESSLDSNVNELELISNNKTNYKGAILTFVDDDCDPTVMEIWKPIIDEHNFKMTFCVVCDRVGGDTSLTLEQLKQLQAEGHDIVSHTYTHKSSRSCSVEELHYEYANSKKWLKDNGFDGYDTVTYPGGIDQQKDHIYIKDIARQYFKNGIATLGSYNTLPVDTWGISRPNADTETLESLKTHLDGAVENNGWLVILSHAYELKKDKSNQMNKIRALITYAKSLNVPILPFREAVKIKGNAISIGEYLKDNCTFISHNGQAKLSSGTIYRNGVAQDINANINTYQKGCKTIETFNFYTDTFLSKGGTLETFRSAESDLYSYSIFHPNGENVYYARRWDYTKKIWKIWENPFEQSTLEYKTGFWTPTLYGSTVAGVHTYATQYGSYTKVGNIVTLRFGIRINYADLDKTMSGNLLIGGLPYTHASSSALNRCIVEYNKLTLGAGFYNVFVGAVSLDNYLKLYKSGSDVSTTFLNTSALTADNVVVFQGTITIQV